jgi:YbgC/YbaW family acyl-CoA thioester hydrolase
MARIKLVLPEHFSFLTSIPVRITDLNYGGHVGNDAILSLVHEARMQYLKSFGFSEMQFDSASLIMSDAGIEFKSEAFYGDVLTVAVTAGDFSRVGFDLFYRFTKTDGEKEVLIALAKTGMICFDYTTRKVVAVPERAKQVLQG